MNSSLKLKVTALVMILFVSAQAFAHPKIDEAIAKYEEADFEGALFAFKEAESVSDLSREDLLQLLQKRALVYFAMGTGALLEKDLSALASLDPNRVLGPETPPEVRSAFEGARSNIAGKVEVKVDTEAKANGVVTFDLVVLHDVQKLSRDVHVWARKAGGNWEVGNEHLEVHAEPGTQVEYYAQAIGPGGSVIAHLGTIDEPKRVLAADLSVAAAPIVQTAPTVRAERETEDDSGALWWVIGGTAAAAAATAIILIVASSGGSDLTQIGRPCVVSPGATGCP